MPFTRTGLAPAFALLAALLPHPAASQTAGPTTETFAIRVHEGTDLAFDLSPDGRSIVIDLLGQLWLLPAGGGEARPITDAVRDTAEDLDPSYGPDGRIVFRGERHGRTGLWLLEPDGTPRQLTQLEDPDGYEGGAAWAPDGRSIVFARLVRSDGSPRWRSRLMRLDPAGGQARELAVLDTVGGDLRDPAWAPDGRRLAVVAGSARRARGGRIWLVEPEGGGATPLSVTTALAPAFAPDGRRLAFLAPDSAGRMQVWVVETGRTDAQPTLLTGHADVAATRVRWSPDGRSVLYTADGGLWSVPVTGGPPAPVRFTAALSIERSRWTLPPARFPAPGRTQPVRAFMGLALSADGRRVGMLALGRLWVMPVGGTPRSLASVPLDAHHLAWSPDGAALVWSAGASREADLFLTEVASGRTRRLTSLPGRESYPAYAPDGRRLAFLHEPAEDTTILRIAEVGTATISRPEQTRAIPAEPGAEAYWTPTSDGILYVTGGFGPGAATRGVILPLAGEPRPVARMPDSPLFLQWIPGSVVFVRHARLWRAPFDTSGMTGPAEPLSPSPAFHLSQAHDGTMLFVSDGGLVLRRPDGAEQRLGWPLSYTPPVAEPLLIRNARIIDGTGRPATEPRDLLVRGGRIEQIGPAGTIEPGTARVLDAGGGHLIPGLMDLHAHEYRPELLPGFLYFGVTTVRDQGSAIGPLVAWADAVAAGIVDGPRVGYGGFQLYSDWGWDTEDGQGLEPEADSGHAARAVALAAAYGAQHVKTRTFRRWDINARLVAEAHRRGLRATGHCAHLLPLVAAGIDAKEHGGFCGPREDGPIYDDLVQLYRAAGIAVVPTVVYSAFAVRLNQRPDLLDGDAELAPFLPPRSDFAWMLELDTSGVRTYRRYAASAAQAVTRLARAGVTLGTGTDIWQIPTGVHMELEELVAAGLSPLEAIRAATGNAARIVGAESELGTIEVGKIADLVLLDADPAADIRNTRRIRAVVQAGRVVDRDGILARVRSRR